MSHSSNFATELGDDSIRPRTRDQSLTFILETTGFLFGATECPAAATLMFRVEVLARVVQVLLVLVCARPWNHSTLACVIFFRFFDLIAGTVSQLGEHVFAVGINRRVGDIVAWTRSLLVRKNRRREFRVN